MEVRDPVCGMHFEVAETGGEIEYGDRRYYFCAEGCMRAFEDDPERYLEDVSDEGSEKST